MTKFELIKAVKSAKRIYGWVRLTEHDGAYIQLTKKSVLFILNASNAADIVYDATIDASNVWIN